MVGVSAGGSHASTIGKHDRPEYVAHFRLGAGGTPVTCSKQAKHAAARPDASEPASWARTRRAADSNAFRPPIPISNRPPF